MNIKKLKVWSIVCGVFAVVSSAASFILNIVFARTATELELLRLKGEASFVESSIASRLPYLIGFVAPVLWSVTIILVLITVGGIIYEKIKSSNN